MKSLYEIETLAEVLDRISQIKPENKAVWGKMNPAQMMEHCARTLDYATGKTKEPRMLIGYILGPLMRTVYYNDKPWGKSTPTSKNFMVTDHPDFEKTKTRLIQRLKEFSAGGTEKCTTHPSPFFGQLTPEQHGLGQYKHIHHHLQQFGV